MGPSTAVGAVLAVRAFGAAIDARLVRISRNFWELQLALHQLIRIYYSSMSISIHNGASYRAVDPG